MVPAFAEPGAAIMSSPNVALVRGILFRLRRRRRRRGALAPVAGLVWNEAENFPYADGNPYRGPEAVAAGVFARCVGEWDGFAVAPEEFSTPATRWWLLGRYRGVNQATGREMNPQLVHVWRIADGKATGFQQYADTLAVARATGAV